MTTKIVSNRIILNETNALDLKVLQKMVKEFIKIYYGEKRKVARHIKGECFTYFMYVPAKKTLYTVFNQFKKIFIDDNRCIKRQFRYLNQNYNSKHKLRDLMVFKLKMDGYSFMQIAKITNLSIVRVKQIYYKIKKMIKNYNYY